MLVLVLMLMLCVNGSIEINVFLSSVNTSINVTVNADVWCDYTLRIVSLFPLIVSFGYFRASVVGITIFTLLLLLNMSVLFRDGITHGLNILQIERCN